MSSNEREEEFFIFNETSLKIMIGLSQKVYQNVNQKLFLKKSRSSKNLFIQSSTQRVHYMDKFCSICIFIVVIYQCFPIVNTTKICSISHHYTRASKYYILCSI